MIVLNKAIAGNRASELFSNEQLKSNVTYWLMCFYVYEHPHVTVCYRGCVLQMMDRYNSL